ncbi:class I SAM-dependent methyltransferase [Candidatus Omnitrophota bacterium]
MERISELTMNQADKRDPLVERYYRDSRPDIFNLVPKESKTVLDIGCGEAELGAQLKARGCEYVAGIELNRKVAEIARTKLDLVLEADVEKLKFPFKDGYFDCIVLGDILEHLIEPWGLLTKLAGYLSDQGCIVCSIPNIRHYSIIVNLILGRWQYQQRGLLDSTHLRFFTLGSIKEMVHQAGYDIIHLQRKILARRSMRFLNRLLLNSLQDFITFHYLIVLKKKGSA